LTAAQTDNAEKKKLLARVIAERLASGPETTLGVASKMACDAIAFATPNQLRILGLQANLLMIKPTRSLPANEYNAWLVVRLSPYMTLSIAQLDLLHLEAISCGAVVQFLGRDLIQALRVKNGDIFDEGMLTSAGILPRLVPLWNERLERFNLTSVGQIIGILVSDIVSGGKTSLERWGA
jgi:hypothetical protein